MEETKQKNQENRENNPIKATKEMSFKDLLDKFPKTSEILHKHELHCIGCMMAQVETLEQGCRMHGKSDEEIEEIINEINS